MTVYSQIAQNKVKSVVLMVLFMALFTLVFYVVGNVNGDPTGYLAIGFVISFASGFASYFFSDKMVLATTGAKPATKEEYFDLYTVVQNVAIASGVPMPKVYVIQDDALNAFATGRNPKHAAVAATTGLLAKLDRAELEGVLAHEMGHVKNYDTLFMSIVAVLVGTLVVVSDWIMRSFMWFGIRRDDREEKANPLQLVFLIVTLILAPLAATLIQLAVSRRREYLADATGALITRNPGALARALQKISGDPRPLQRASGATAHLFITNPFKDKKVQSKIQSLFSTHPPVEDRIKKLIEM